MIFFGGLGWGGGGGGNSFLKRGVSIDLSVHLHGIYTKEKVSKKLLSEKRGDPSSGIPMYSCVAISTASELYLLHPHTAEECCHFKLMTKSKWETKSIRLWQL